MRRIVGHTEATVVNLDMMRYAGNLESLGSVEDHPRYRFERVDICDGRPVVGEAFRAHPPDGVIQLAA